MPSLTRASEDGEVPQQAGLNISIPALPLCPAVRLSAPVKASSGGTGAASLPPRNCSCPCVMMHSAAGHLAKHWTCAWLKSELHWEE